MPISTGPSGLAPTTRTPCMSGAACEEISAITQRLWRTLRAPWQLTVRMPMDTTIEDVHKGPWANSKKRSQTLLPASSSHRRAPAPSTTGAGSIGALEDSRRLSQTLPKLFRMTPIMPTPSTNVVEQAVPSAGWMMPSPTSNPRSASTPSMPGPISTSGLPTGATGSSDRPSTTSQGY